jgi:hypothetical protein
MTNTTQKESRWGSKSREQAASRGKSRTRITQRTLIFRTPAMWQTSVLAYPVSVLPIPQIHRSMGRHSAQQIHNYNRKTGRTTATEAASASRRTTPSLKRDGHASTPRFPFHGSRSNSSSGCWQRANYATLAAEEQPTKKPQWAVAH